MVFKRYIYKNGKKLGPYYYENIRTPDGKVKTIYVGNNPSHHTKHKIRRPLFFIILVLIMILILGGSLFVMQNKSYLEEKVKPQQPDFDVDQILLKVLVKSNEFIEKQIRVSNSGSNPTEISIESSGLSDLLKISSNFFAINPGQIKIVALNFTSFDEQQKVEQQPGIYAGKLIVKSKKTSKEIPVIAEIETKNVLFDLNLNPVAIDRKVKQGSDTTIEVKVFNLESIESVNVDVEYFVKDMNGNTITTESETVVAKTQASFFKTISIPKNLKQGPYIFGGQARLGNSVGTASYLFEVIGQEPKGSFVEFCKSSVMCLGLSLATILLLFALAAYFYFFIGAYLYEKFIAFRSKKEKTEADESIEEEAAEPDLNVIESIKNKFLQWKEERRFQRQEQERLEREQELKELEQERIEEAGQSKHIKEFYSVFDRANSAFKNDDRVRMQQLYVKARDIYTLLPSAEKKEVYGNLMGLYKKMNEIVKENQKQEKAKKDAEKSKRQKEEEQKRRLEEEKRRKLREKIRQFFHNIGVFKTPEERKQNQIWEKRPSWLKKFFEDKKPLPFKKRADEFEELEKSIKDLRFFKKLEEVPIHSTEKTKEVIKEHAREQKISKVRQFIFGKIFGNKEKIISKSKKLEEYYKLWSDALAAAARNDIAKAKELYIDARNKYMSLYKEEKKEVYGSLMELYKKLTK